MLHLSTRYTLYGVDLFLKSHCILMNNKILKISGHVIIGPFILMNLDGN